LRILGPLGLNASRDLRGYDTPKGDKLTKKSRFIASLPHPIAFHPISASLHHRSAASLLQCFTITASRLHCFTL
jgi:hypothetical protein